MKFELRKIIAVVLTLALVVTTITFTAGNSLKAEEVGEGAGQTDEQSLEVENTEEESNIDSESTEEPVINEENTEEPQGEAEPALGVQSLTVQEEPGEESDTDHEVKLHAKGGNPGVSGFTMKGVYFSAQGSFYHNDNCKLENLGGTHTIYVGGKEFGKITLEFHGKGNGKDAGNATDNYWITKFTPAEKEMTLDVSGAGYYGVYDGDAHGGAVVAKADGKTVAAKIQYSTDGGATWSSTVPTITNVGTNTVLVKASYDGYKDATGSYTQEVIARPVVIKVNDKMITLGESFEVKDITGTIEGLLQGDDLNVTYKLDGVEKMPTEVGVYDDILGAAYDSNDNYTVTVENGTLTISAAVVLDITGFDGLYDGENHSGKINSVTEGATIYYSTDGGATWTTDRPSVKDVADGTINVKAKATKNGYEDSNVVDYILKANPVAITIKAKDASKVVGEKDPAFSAEITEGKLVAEGDLGTITASRANDDQEVGTYVGVIEPAYTNTANTNYTVTLENGDFTIMDKLVIEGQNYEGVYDGKKHSGTVSPQQAVEGVTYLYSTDDGNTWTAEEPSYKNAGEYTYLVKGKADGYGESDPIEIKVDIAKKALKIITPSDTKKYDGKALTNKKAQINGLIEGEYLTVVVTGSQTEVGESLNTVEYGFGEVTEFNAEAALEGNYTVDVELGTLTVTEADDPVPTPEPTPGNNGGNGGNNTALVATGNADGGTTLTRVATEETPLAGSLLDAHCCILHLLIMLAAMLMLFWYTTDMKKRQRRIFELEEEIADMEE